MSWIANFVFFKNSEDLLRKYWWYLYKVEFYSVEVESFNDWTLNFICPYVEFFIIGFCEFLSSTFFANSSFLLFDNWI